MELPVLKIIETDPTIFTSFQSAFNFKKEKSRAYGVFYLDSGNSGIESLEITQYG